MPMKVLSGHDEILVLAVRSFRPSLASHALELRNA